MGRGGDDQGKHDDESLGRVGRCRVLVAVICVWPLLRWWRDRVGVASDGSGDSDGVGLEMATTWDNTHNESAEYTMLIPHFLVLTWGSCWSFLRHMVCHFSRLLDTGGLESWAFAWSCGAVSTLTFCPLVIHTRENPGIGVEDMRAKGRRRWQGYGNQGGGGCPGVLGACPLPIMRDRASRV